MSHATLPLWQDAADADKLDKLSAMVDDLYRYQLAAQVQQVIAILEAHTPADDKERADMQHIITMCQAHPNIMSPLCEPAHLTGSALVVHPPTKRVLLNHHRKFDRWMQFGGHMDNDLAPHITALREAREETGLSDVRFVGLDATHVRGASHLEPRPFDIDVHDIPQRAERPAHQHLDLRYLVATDRPNDIATSDESIDVRWFTLAELDALNLEPGVWRMIRKAERITGRLLKDIQNHVK